MRIRRVALGGGIALVLCVPLVISVAAGANPDKLISRGRPAVASSDRGGRWAAGQATDADPATRWESAAGPRTQWVRIDLGAVRNVDRVLLRWGDQYARTFRVQTSTDGANWTDVYATGAGNGGADDLKRLGGAGRYIRVLATQRGADSGGYSLSEIKAYGPSAAPLPAVSPATGSLASGLDNPRKKEIALE